MTTTCTVTFGSVTFTGAEIKEARVVEEVNPLSVELPINTIELTLFSAAGDFSIINPSGFYANLKYLQPLGVSETIDGTPYYIGKFYLETWESISENEAKFRAIDAIGLLDKIPYYGDMWTTGTGPIDSDDLIAAIMAVAGIAYSLDASLNGISLTGWIPITTCREALQQVCFRIGAYVKCARSSVVNILPMELASSLTSYDYTITNAQRGLGQPITLKPLVTGVQIKSHDYYARNPLPTPFAKIFEATLGVGTHTILFSQPVFTTGYSGTATYTLTATESNHFIVNVTVAGTVIIELQGDWIDNQKVFSVLNGSLPVGTPTNPVVIDDATIVDAATAQTITQRVYDYYQQRYLQRARLYALPIAPGHSVLMAAQSGWIGGIVERMETDLTRGFISQAEIVGVVASTCTNILTTNLTVTTGNDQTYAGCLDTFDFNIDLQGSANLIIT